MGNNSVKNISKIITNTLVESVISTVQKASNNSVQSQTINVDCNEINGKVIQARIDCIEKIKNLGWTTEQMLKFCPIEQGITCGANHIEMSNSIKTNFTSEMNADIQSSIQQTIANKISQKATQDLNIVDIGKKMQNEIDDISNSVAKEYIDNIQTSNEFNSMSQTINITGGEVSYINLSLASDIISKYVQSNKTISSQINSLSNDIQQTASQSSDNPIVKILVMIVAFIIFLLIIISIILYIIKNSKRVSK